MSFTNFQILVAAAFGDGAEEFPLLEVTVLVEVPESFLSAESWLPLGELLVVLVFESLVPEDDVVGAGDVLGVVFALASASDGVADLQLRTLVVGEVVEVERRPVEAIAVVEVLDVDDVLVEAAPRVDGVPAAQDEERSEDLVPQLLGVDLAVFVVDLRHEDLLDVFSHQRLGSGALVLAPLWVPLHALKDVQHGRVVLAVVLVEGRSAVVGEDVVDVAPSLRDVGLASVLPALDEELLHVLVGDVALRRDELLLRGLPTQFVAPRELARVL